MKKESLWCFQFKRVEGLVYQQALPLVKTVLNTKFQNMINHNRSSLAFFAFLMVALLSACDQKDYKSDEVGKDIIDNLTYATRSLEARNRLYLCKAIENGKPSQYQQDMVAIFWILHRYVSASVVKSGGYDPETGILMNSLDTEIASEILIELDVREELKSFVVKDPKDHEPALSSILNPIMRLNAKEVTLGEIFVVTVQVQCEVLTRALYSERW